MSDIEGKVRRVGASERGQRTSIKIVCCNFCKGLFLKAAIEEELVNTLYAESNQKTVP
jgi:hypothetical protein